MQPMLEELLVSYDMYMQCGMAPVEANVIVQVSESMAKDILSLPKVEDRIKLATLIGMAKLLKDSVGSKD